MDWIWRIYEAHVDRLAGPRAKESDRQALFFAILSESTATLFAMEPTGDTIRFKSLGRWHLAEVSDLVADPNGFIADRFGGGKFKVNFHHRSSFIGTHNFRTFGPARWVSMAEVNFDEPGGAP